MFLQFNIKMMKTGAMRFAIRGGFCPLLILSVAAAGYPRTI
jgi:hypothetical protein